MADITTAPPTEAPIAAPVSSTPTPAPAAPAPAAPSPWEVARQAITPASTWADLPVPQAPAKPIIDTTGRAHAPETGQFVQKPADLGTTAPLAPVPAPEAPAVAPAAEPTADAEPEAAPAAPPAPPVADAPQGDTLVLTDRNGRELELTVSDPAVAEVLRMYKNNGLRREQADRITAEAREKVQEVQQFVATWDTTPELVFDKLRPDLQQRLAQYILATRFDTDFDTIKQFAEDPVARREKLVDLRDAIHKGSAERDQRLTAQQHAERVSDAIKAQIPATADETQAQRFLGAAAAYITGLVTQGTAVTPESIPELLAPFRSAYGLTDPAPTAPPAAPSPAPTSTDDLAARKAKATATVQRLVRVADQRAVAQAVAPQGAGVAPVAAPMPPKGASIDEVTALLKERIRPGMSWTDYNQLK